MRKLRAILLAAFMLLSLAACGSNGQTPPAQGVIERLQQNETTASTGSNILIAYFTVPETDGIDTVANASRVATDSGVVGNTEFIAMEIQKNLGGDLFAIETVQEYPGSHDPLLEFAYNEKSDDARPELSTHLERVASRTAARGGSACGTPFPAVHWVFWKSAILLLLPPATMKGTLLARTEKSI